MIYLYAITDRPGTPLPEGSLHEVESNGLAAVFARTDAEPEPTPEALWAHENVIEELMRERAVLPMRYGTRLAGQAAVHALLDTRGDEFERLLDGVRGRVELSVRVAGGDAPAAGRPANGAAYMQQRLEERRRAQRIAAAVHEPLARIADRSTSDPSPRAGFLLVGSYLLPDTGVDRFTGQVRELQRTNPELALTCTGPWPPYSFVDEVPA